MTDRAAVLRVHPGARALPPDETCSRTWRIVNARGVILDATCATEAEAWWTVATIDRIRTAAWPRAAAPEDAL